MTAAEMARRALERVRCQDDSVAPVDWYLCTEPDLHAGDHVATGVYGAVVARWSRGRGRAAGELRRHFGLDG